jgi:hypothetical protein
MGFLGRQVITSGGQSTRLWFRDYGQLDSTHINVIDEAWSGGRRYGGHLQYTLRVHSSAKIETVGVRSPKKLRK